METLKINPNYSINRSGVIKNIKTGNILKHIPNNDSYMVAIYINGVATLKSVNKIMYNQFVEAIDLSKNDYVIINIDKNPLNFSPENLKQVSRAELIKERSLVSKLKNAEVEIESEYNRGISQKELANKYDVSQSTISRKLKSRHN